MPSASSNLPPSKLIIVLILKVPLLIACFVLLATRAMAQQGWFGPEVAKEIGIETCATCPPPRYPATTYQIEKYRIASITIALFDTTGTYVQGRVVSVAGKPLAGAVVRVDYCSNGSSRLETKTVTTNNQGFFRLGWVGSYGVAGPRSNHSLSVQSAGYQPLETQKVVFGGSAYLHIVVGAVETTR